MNELQLTILGGISMHEICASPGNYPDEVIAAAFDALKGIKSLVREYEINVTGDMIRRMREDNATKVPFINVGGIKKFITLKKGAMKINSSIKDIEEYIKKSGLAPEQIGEYKFTPFSWGKCKEIRKMGGSLQLVIDELYQEGTPSLTVTDAKE